MQCSRGRTRLHEFHVWETHEHTCTHTYVRTFTNLTELGLKYFHNHVLHTLSSWSVVNICLLIHYLFVHIYRFSLSLDSSLGGRVCHVYCRQRRDSESVGRKGEGGRECDEGTLREAAEIGKTRLVNLLAFWQLVTQTRICRWAVPHRGRLTAIRLRACTLYGKYCPSLRAWNQYT